jgi:hypothetical protein
MLISETRWEQLDQIGQTLAQLFADALEEDTAKHVFDLDMALQRNVGSVAGLTGIDLLPSSLQLIDVKDRLGSMPVGRFWNRSAGQILETEVKHILSDYDVVLIDCPPDMGVVTLNGLRIADGYIIPTIPDVLSSARVAAPKAAPRGDDGRHTIDRHGDPRRVVNRALPPPAVSFAPCLRYCLTSGAADDNRRASAVDAPRRRPNRRHALVMARPVPRCRQRRRLSVGRPYLAHRSRRPERSFAWIGAVAARAGWLLLPGDCASELT